MSIVLKWDVIPNTISNLTYSLTGARLSKTITRNVFINGLSMSGSGATLTSDIADQAIEYIQGSGLVPPLTPHPNDTSCLARTYNFNPDPIHPLGGFITIGYQWQFADTTLECSGGLQGTSTDSEFITSGSPALRTPIVISWVPNAFMGTPGATVTGANGSTITVPTNGIYWAKSDGTLSTNSSDAATPMQSNCSVPYQQPTFGFSITQVVTSSVYDNIQNAARTYLGCCNSETFSAAPSGGSNAAYMWLCDSINCSGDVVSQYFQVSLHFTWRQWGWVEFVRGTFTPPDATNLWSYDATGTWNPNGFYQAHPLPVANLDSLIAILG